MAGVLAVAPATAVSAQGAAKAGDDLNASSTYIDSQLSKSTIAVGESTKLTNTITTPFSGPGGQTEMTTTVPPGLKFKSAEKLPDTWSLEYFTEAGGWSSSQPADPATIKRVRAKGSATDEKAEGSPLVPPIEQGKMKISGGGDGFNPMFFENEIWVVNHHETPEQKRWIKCFDRKTGDPCPRVPDTAVTAAEFGTYIPSTSGQKFGEGVSDFSTPMESISFINQTTGKIYVPVQKDVPKGTTGSTDVGWVCGDLKKLESCGFVKVGSQEAPIRPFGPDGTYAWPNFLPSQVWGVPSTVDAGFQYSVGQDGTIYCFDVALGKNCTRANTNIGQTFNYTVGGPASTHFPEITVTGDKITDPTARYAWLVSPQSQKTAKFACVDMNSGQSCGTPVSPALGDPSGDPFSTSFGVPTPVYAQSGSFLATCIQVVAAGFPADANLVRWQWNCYTTALNTGVAATNTARTLLTTAVNTAPHEAGTINAPLVGNMIQSNFNADPSKYFARTFSAIPYVNGTRLYMPVIQSWERTTAQPPPSPGYKAKNMVVCVDFATAGPCDGFTINQTEFWDNMIYTLGKQSADCMWWQGDAGLLQALNPESGQLSCDWSSFTPIEVNPPAECAPSAFDGANWHQVEIPNMPADSKAEIKVVGVDQTVVLTGTITRQSPTLNLSSLPVSGNTRALKVDVTLFVPPSPGVPIQLLASVSWKQPNHTVCLNFEPVPDCPQTADWTTLKSDVLFTKPNVTPINDSVSANVTVTKANGECEIRLQKYIGYVDPPSVRDPGQVVEDPPGLPFGEGQPVFYGFKVWTPGKVWSLGKPDLTDDNATPNDPSDDYRPTYVSGDGPPPNEKLDPGEDWFYKSQRTALVGTHTNTAKVTAPGATNGPVFSKAVYNATPPSIKVVKNTNGVHATQPGLELIPGDPVTWTYKVTNTGRSTLKDIKVVDDKVGVITCPKTTLAPDESMTCTASGTVKAGVYENQVTVTGKDPWDKPVKDEDNNTYTGASPAISIEKKINGAGNLDVAGSLSVPVTAGSQLQVTFLVKNTGNTPLINVSVTDKSLTAGGQAFNPVSCPKDWLALNDSMTCTATGTALTGEYLDQGTVVGTGTFSDGKTPLRRQDGSLVPPVTDDSKAGYRARQQLPIIVDPVDEDKFGDGYTTLIKDSSTAPQGVIKRRVFCRPFRPSAAGEIAYCKVRITKKGAVKVRVRGYGKVKVTVQIKAKPKPQYKGDWTSNSWRRTWILKGNTTL